MVEGARLESVYTGNRIAGSNPAPSARPPYRHHSPTSKTGRLLPFSSIIGRLTVPPPSAYIAHGAWDNVGTQWRGQSRN